MTGLEGFEDMSLESVEKGRTLDVDELDDDGWRVVCTEKRIQELGSLGEGAGGAVTRCVLKGGKMIFALKIITTTPDPDVKRQIVREIGFNKECAHEHICKYYGAFVDPSTATISIAMEFCEGGSLDSIYREVQRGKGRVGEGVLGKVAVGVLTGLSYLHTKKIMHRDIKPSNILLCRDGQVKLCDFGVSGEFGTKGDANTFIGTSYYMAPERITGQRYTITSDVWSTGVTLLEVAQNRFPFPADGTEAQPRAGLIDLLTFIVRQPVPELKDEIFYYLNKEYEENEEIIYLKKQTMTHEELELLKEDERIKEDPTISEEMKDQMMTFRVLPITRSREFKNFIAECLIKDPTERKTPWRLLASDPWMIEMKHAKVKIAKFLRQVWGWER
ncbi:putative MAP kinase kinase MKK1/SSP32 [Glarea lozoyensis 74030]|nr:putative MAP kinase kinase MKK1/SSP32 [Glarea lozoyensis 74030]